MSCLECDGKSKFRCSKCHTATYCSRQCQKKNWAAHKKACTTVDRLLCDLKCKGITDIEEICRIGLSNDAVDTAECHCSRCAQLCQHVPGNYTPWQFKVNGSGNKMTDEEIKQRNLTFDNCVQDYYASQNRPTVFFLRPKNVAEVDRCRAKLPLFTNCIHLGEHGCTLARKDMPLGCTSVLGCKPEVEPMIVGSRLVMAWGTKHGLQVIKDFEDYHRQKENGLQSVGKDALFDRELEMYNLAIGITKVMIEDDKTNGGDIYDTNSTDRVRLLKKLASTSSFHRAFNNSIFSHDEQNSIRQATSVLFAGR